MAPIHGYLRRQNGTHIWIGGDVYVYVAIAIAAAIASGTAVWNVQNWRFDSQRLAAAEQVREVEKFRRQAANKGATAHEADKVRIRTEFVPITKEVERVVTQIEYRDRACLTDDGLHAINAAVARANGHPAEPSDTVPKSAKP